MKVTLGENIKIMRRKCGFTQEELAQRLAVTPQAVSKWENGNGTPDISQLIPLSQIFGITTDSLLGVVSAVFGKAHTEAALGHEKLLMSTEQPIAEKHFAAYSYFRAESEKEPTNYEIMRRCINHGAEVSRYVDFDNFLSDKPELRSEIFADCERKNHCISRYCEDKNIVQKSDYAMIWIYLHIKDFDKAKELIDKLPSLESNILKEHIMTQYIHFQYGFEKEKDYISDNILMLLNAVGKEFFYDIEDYAWFADGGEAIGFSEKLLGVIDAFKAFDNSRTTALEYENRLRQFLPRCYAKLADYDKAAEQLVIIAENSAEISKGKEKDEASAYIMSEISSALFNADECDRSRITDCAAYKRAVAIADAVDGDNAANADI